MDRGGTLLEPSRSPAIPHSREDIPTGGHTHNGASPHNHSGPKNGNGNGGSSSQNRSNPSTPAKKDLSHITCFKCGKTGQYATECSEAKNGNGKEALGRSPTLSTEDK